MRSTSQLFSPLVALAMLVFVYELVMYPANDWGNKILIELHKSEYDKQLFPFTKFISYLLLFSLIGIFGYELIISKPCYGESWAYIGFLIMTVAASSWLKLIFAELRPFEYAVLENKNEIQMIDKEPDFGMPSGHLFVASSLFYAVKVRYFEKFNSSSLEAYETYFKCEKSVLSSTRHSARFIFNLFTIIYLLILSICRFIAHSHFLPQTVFGLLYGYIWSYLYFRYIFVWVKTAFIEAATNLPKANRRFMKLFGGFVIIYIIGLLIVITQSLLYNEQEKNKLEAYLVSKCGEGSHMGFKNFKDSLIGLSPLFALYFYRFNKVAIKNNSDGLPSYSELNYFQKFLRIIVLAFMLGIGVTIRMVYKAIAKKCGKKIYPLISSFSFLLILISVTFILVVVNPLIYSKLGILLKEEIFILDNTDSANKKAPVMLVFTGYSGADRTPTFAVPAHFRYELKDNFHKKEVSAVSN